MSKRDVLIGALIVGFMIAVTVWLWCCIPGDLSGEVIAKFTHPGELGEVYCLLVETSNGTYSVSVEYAQYIVTQIGETSFVAPWEQGWWIAATVFSGLGTCISIFVFGLILDEEFN